MNPYFLTISKKQLGTIREKLCKNLEEPIQRSRFFEDLSTEDALQKLLNVIFFSCHDLKPLQEKRRVRDLFQIMLHEFPDLKLPHHRQLNILLGRELSQKMEDDKENRKGANFLWDVSYFPEPFTVQEINGLVSSSQESDLIENDEKMSNDIALLSALLQLSSHKEAAANFSEKGEWFQCVATFVTILLKKFLIIAEKVCRMQMSVEQNM